jgi:hypothetical protein
VDGVYRFVELLHCQGTRRAGGKAGGRAEGGIQGGRLAHWAANRVCRDAVRQRAKRKVTWHDIILENETDIKLMMESYILKGMQHTHKKKAD